MKTKFASIFRRTTLILSIVVFITAATVAHATTHVVQFGGSFGFAYSPNSLNVSVGDTIKWQGDFSMHPLSSTSVPTGASSFHQGSGSVFIYPITVAGTYLYQCDFHFSLGMIGSFTASVVTVTENDQTSFRPDAFKLEQNFPNPFNPATTISFDLPVQTYVSLKIYNIIGQEVTTIVNEDMTAGSYSRIWNASSMSSGIYFYRLQTKSFTDTRKLILLK